MKKYPNLKIFLIFVYKKMLLKTLILAFFDHILSQMRQILKKLSQMRQIFLKSVAFATVSIKEICRKCDAYFKKYVANV